MARCNPPPGGDGWELLAGPYSDSETEIDQLHRAIAQLGSRPWRTHTTKEGEWLFIPKRSNPATVPDLRDKTLLRNYLDRKSGSVAGFENR